MADKEVVELLEKRVLSFMRQHGLTVYWATNYHGKSNKVTGKDFSRRIAPYLEGVIRRAK